MLAVLGRESLVIPAAAVFTRKKTAMAPGTISGAANPMISYFGTRPMAKVECPEGRSGDDLYKILFFNRHAADFPR